MNVASKRRHSNETEEESYDGASSLRVTTRSQLPTLREVSAAVVSDTTRSITINPNLKIEDCSVIAAPPVTKQDTVPGNDRNNCPTHIPEVESGSGAPEFRSNNVEVEEEEENGTNSSNMTSIEAENEPTSIKHGGEDIDDESDYEYEDEDDLAFSGFLMSSANTGATASAPSSSTPARIEEDSAVASSPGQVADAELSADTTETEATRKKWREPSRAAVNMSLRAEQETSGSKRRLAQDLYRIMNQDTEEAGFSLAPKSEDSMDLWTIKLFQFDPDSNLAKDMMVLGINHIELEMKFPEHYPFEPPFVRVVKPRFKKQTGFVMNGALCMELLTKDGWNPINDIESVIVSIRSLLVVGDGRLQAASELSDARYKSLLEGAHESKTGDEHEAPQPKKPRIDGVKGNHRTVGNVEGGSYTAAEAQSAYSHLSDYHKKKGWDTSGWWARKG